MVTPSKLAAAITMREQGELTMVQITKALNISRAALYRKLGPALEQGQSEKAAYPSG